METGYPCWTIGACPCHLKTDPRAIRRSGDFVVFDSSPPKGASWLSKFQESRSNDPALAISQVGCRNRTHPSSSFVRQFGIFILNLVYINPHRTRATHGHSGRVLFLRSSFSETSVINLHSKILLWLRYSRDSSLTYHDSGIALLRGIVLIIAR